MLKTLKHAILSGVAIVGDYIDWWSENPILRNRITELTTRVAELELENERLRSMDDINDIDDDLVDIDDSVEFS